MVTRFPFAYPDLNALHAQLRPALDAGEYERFLDTAYAENDRREEVRRAARDAERTCPWATVFAAEGAGR